MKRIALLWIYLVLTAACGDPRPEPAQDKAAVNKSLVFKDGTTAHFYMRQLDPEQWVGVIEAGSFAIGMQGIRTENLFTFHPGQCSPQAKLEVDLDANEASFSNGLIEATAKVSDPTENVLHPATGTWDYFAEGITYAREVTTFSLRGRFMLAAFDNLLLLATSPGTWRMEVSYPDAQEPKKYFPIETECTSIGERLHSDEFYFSYLYFLGSEKIVTGKFDDSFTSVTFNFPSPVTQRSKRWRP